jgi:hypothetical protein
VRDYQDHRPLRNKAKNVIALSQQLIEEHGGEVPATARRWRSLPGVGRKTANVVLNMAFGSRPWRSTRMSSASATAPGPGAGQDAARGRARVG